MKSGNEKRTTTFRFNEITRQRLDRASLVTQRSQNSIMESALDEWFERHGFIERYIASVNDTHVVLVRHDRDKIYVMDVQERNGLSPEKMAEAYATRFKAPVDLVVEGTQGDTR